MHILVIGGTRFIGPAVVDELLGGGHSVTVFNRGNSELKLPAEVKVVTGDRRDPDYDTAILKAAKPDAVVDMCCITADDAFWLSGVFNGHCGRLVLVSSCDVYRAYGRLIGTEPGEPDDVPLTEDSPLREKRYPYRGEEPRADDDPRRILDDYDKIPAEEHILGLESIEGVVTRLPMVYGPRDYQRRFWPYLSQMTAENGEIQLSERQAQWGDCRAFVGDVAHGIALAATHPSAHDSAYNIAEESNECLGDWVRRIATAVGWHGEVRFDGEVAEEDTTFYEQHLSIDSSRIRNELGYHELKPVEERIKLTAQWERNNPPPEPSGD